MNTGALREVVKMINFLSIKDLNGPGKIKCFLMKRYKFLLCIILVFYSCNHFRSEEKLDQVYNRINVTNPSLFRDWQISNRDGSNLVSSHYIPSDMVFYAFISYNDGDSIILRTVSKEAQETFWLDVDNPNFRSINGFDVVRTYFNLKVDHIAYSSSLNGMIFEKGAFYFAYLFQPIDSAFIASIPYKCINGQCYYYAR